MLEKASRGGRESGAATASFPESITTDIPLPNSQALKTFEYVARVRLRYSSIWNIIPETLYYLAPVLYVLLTLFRELSSKAFLQFPVKRIHTITHSGLISHHYIKCDLRSHLQRFYICPLLTSLIASQSLHHLVIGTIRLIEKNPTFDILYSQLC